MDKKDVAVFIDDYCRLVLKHKMQFSFGFTDLSDKDAIVYSEVAIKTYNCGLIIGQTYPNEELAAVVRGLNINPSI